MQYLLQVKGLQGKQIFILSDTFSETFIRYSFTHLKKSFITFNLR